MPKALESEELAPLTAAVRRFNRFYTRQIGVLQDGLSRSSFSLTEARVIYELAHRRRATATKLGEELGLDAGYLSRILRRFDENGLIERAPSETDARQVILSLTPAGHTAFASLDAATKAEIDSMLRSLGPSGRNRLVHAMGDIERVLSGESEQQAPYMLRPHGPGDMGWVVQRQSVLYAREYGWNAEYEVLASRIVADFLERFDSSRERCWIAERDGVNVGAVFLMRHPEREGVAKLRLLHVEPSARGLGIGARLVHECTRFARDTGYHTITLWTNSVLRAARALYEAEGYTLVDEAPHTMFGAALTGQTWELALKADEG